MGKFEGLLICTDLDGTLFKNDKTISKENLDAIEYFKNEGGYFTFITGRMPFFSHDAFNTINPNCPFGCINGGGIYDHRKMEYVWKMPISPDALEIAKYIHQKMDCIGIQISSFDEIFFTKDNEATQWFRGITGVPHLKCSYDEVPLPIAKIIFADTDDDNITKLEKVLSSHSEAHKYDFVRSEEYLYEMLPKGSNKGIAIKKLSEILNIDIKKTIAIGDYYNDVQMLKTAGLGVAVANATDEAKAAADRITVSNEDNAIAKIISELDEGKIIL